MESMQSVVSNRKEMVRIVCCGFPVTRQKYADTFKVVELRQVFYQTPLVSTIQKWCVEVPLDFKYTIQAW